VTRPGPVRRTAAAAAAAVVAGALLAACGSSGGTASAVGSVTAPDVEPAGAAVVSAVGPAAASDTSCNGGHPTASLAPQGALPRPGVFAAGTWMAHVESRGYLIAGVDQNTLLWGYRDATTGQLSGFDIDMIQQVADALFPDGATNAARVHFVVVPNADRVGAVQSGAVDIVAETMTITCARETSVDFSSEYYDAGQRILVPDGSTVTSSAGLGGKRVCAPAGSTSLSTLHALAKPPTLVAATNQTDCLVLLQQGQVDAISTDDTILQGLAAQDPNVHLLAGAPLADEPYGMAISKSHPEFTRFVNAVLANERSDGTWKKIWTRWLGSVETTPAPAPPVAVYRD
jgi:polar amino acid transport system substrate-binding protein